MINALSDVFDLTACRLCPRECGVNRYERAGVCGCNATVKAARAMLHYGEEPCLCTAERGSGAVFFSGCVLKCVYCQNYHISGGNYGKEITVERLAEIFLELQAQNAANINLVTPTQYAPQLVAALKLCGERLTIPIVYNCGGYESTDAIRALDGFVDVYLTDFKYISGEIAGRYSKAADYGEKAGEALCEMSAQVGKPIFDDNGMLTRGLIVRHMVLPGCYRDSLAVMDFLHDNLKAENFLLSLMSQYTPCAGVGEGKYPELDRRVTTFEYKKVLARAEEYGFDGFMQQRTAATLDLRPDFDTSGI